MNTSHNPLPSLTMKTTFFFLNPPLPSSSSPPEGALPQRPAAPRELPPAPQHKHKKTRRSGTIPRTATHPVPPPSSAAAVSGAGAGSRRLPGPRSRPVDGGCAGRARRRRKPLQVTGHCHPVTRGGWDRPPPFSLPAGSPEGATPLPASTPHAPPTSSLPSPRRSRPEAASPSLTGGGQAVLPALPLPPARPPPPALCAGEQGEGEAGRERHGGPRSRLRAGPAPSTFRRRVDGGAGGGARAHRSPPPADTARVAARRAGRSARRGRPLPAAATVTPPGGRGGRGGGRRRSGGKPVAERSSMCERRRAPAAPS